MIRNVQRYSAIVMILAGISFALVAIAAIWGAFEDEDTTWRALGTLAVIAFTSLIVNVGSRIYDQGMGK